MSADVHDFDRLDRAQLAARPSHKWQRYEPDVLPLWVADMDFPIAEPIREAMRTHLATDNFGYPPEEGLPGVREAVVERLHASFGWSVPVEAVEPTSGVIPAMFACVETFTEPGDRVVVPSPLYPWFLRSIERTGRTPAVVDLVRAADGRYVLDHAGLEDAARGARMLMLCNPHNPVGRVFTRAELEPIAALAVERDLIVVSDELHADLRYGRPHVPFASLGRDAAQRTITLYGPTKSYNLAGLKIGFVIVENDALRERFHSATHGPLPAPNVLGQVAARAALRDSGAWLTETLAYLDANRRMLADRIARDLPGVGFTAPEATYLAWLDFRGTELGRRPADAILERARVAVNDGADFGPSGAGFVRLNFATARHILEEALDRIADLLADP